MNGPRLSARSRFLVSRITLLFIVSYVFLWLHILDDAIITNEPAWYGITIPEFLISCAIVYAILPPLGLFWARRGSLAGLTIVLVYAFQAIYGAGLNHVKHMLGNFSGSQLLPTLLNAAGIHITDIRGYGFWTVIMGMLGLGVTPPHTHILASSIVAFLNVGLNFALILLTASALYAGWQARRARHPAHAETPAPERLTAPVNPTPE